jgi:hypothetical protein
MAELGLLFVALLAVGGAGVIGLLVLFSGLVAERRSSVIWCAAIAAILFASQILFVLFWHRFGVGFGGESRRGQTILIWATVIAIALVAGFLAIKLPGSRSLRDEEEELKQKQEGAGPIAEQPEVKPGLGPGTGLD